MTDPQPALFDPARTTSQPCPVPGCQAIRLPSQDRVITCTHDLQRDYAKRPKGCLNTIDPATTEIPF